MAECRQFGGQGFHPRTLFRRLGYRNTPRQANAFKRVGRLQAAGNQKTGSDQSRPPYALPAVDRDILTGCQIAIEILDKSQGVPLGGGNPAVDDWKGTELHTSVP